MSQAGLNNTSAGPVPPAVATSYVTNVNSPAIPAANIINEIGGSTTANNNNGIRTDGSSGSNTLTTQLTNRLQGSGSTVGAVTTTIATMNLGATAGNYAWEFYVSGYESTGPSGTAYNIMSCIRTTGAAGTLVGVSDESFVEDAALAASDVQITVTGNSVNVTCIGIALLTINWNVVATYVFQG